MFNLLMPTVTILYLLLVITPTTLQHNVKNRRRGEGTLHHNVNSITVTASSKDNLKGEGILTTDAGSVTNEYVKEFGATFADAGLTENTGKLDKINGKSGENSGNPTENHAEPEENSVEQKVKSLSSTRNKRSYSGLYLYRNFGPDSEIGPHPEISSRIIGSNPETLPETRLNDNPIRYENTQSWDRKSDELTRQHTGYEKGKRSEDSFLHSNEYETLSPWSRKRLDDNSYMESIGYGPIMRGGWGKRTYPDMMKSRHSDNRYPYLQMADKDSPSIKADEYYYKKSPSRMDLQGFHEGIFDSNFGKFSPLIRGKRQINQVTPKNYETKSVVRKREYGMGSRGFHGDTFNEGWGGFSTMKKRRPEWDSNGFYGDTFSGGFGDFGTMKKRRPEMTSSGFYGDMFSNGFGDFGTMKKRRPEMTSSGFYGDTFSGGFGDSFSTMKRNHMKRRLEWTPSGFYGDTFSGGFGDFSPMKRRGSKADEEEQSEKNAKDSKLVSRVKIMRKRRNTEAEKSKLKREKNAGSRGETFSASGIKIRPEMTSNGFHGDMVSDDFVGNFYTTKKKNDGRPDNPSNFSIRPRNPIQTRTQ